ncbi:MAG: DNA-formamidopyrimidine glycosylase [Candidatus Vogelbacteria bacterium RIFOXYD1_FULL_46_19]|uniref:DNA-formamidopyrimidine glycosylase n=1 Tax=Candidatus Vogelbacteria bacterium RIFOXYD1_FULL_46_19 TaxID=1802439 RepID=A0A1G2QIB7_9BACT|nr:MAG: DNA-formamidopyrimidine glycosylase [Candidatus Vogelbacteria bacterium RIFOXYD1_FULL_46_19]
MPELPEVETVARDLNRVLKNHVIKKVVVRVPKMILPLSAEDFGSGLKTWSIEKVSRRAKIIVINLSKPKAKAKKFLLIHLKMTGQLIWMPKIGQAVIGGHPQPGGGHNLPHKHTHAEFHFQDGSVLYFNDMRKFGWLKLVTESEKEIILSPHGVEPLAKDFSLTIFTNLITKYPNRTLKHTLLDQKLIAGLGNIYVDEACFKTGVLPTRPVHTLSRSDLTKLHQEIVAVLKLSIKKKGTSARNYVRADGTKGGFVPYLNVYGRAGLACKQCGNLISKTKHAGRGTHFCSKCQK